MLRWLRDLLERPHQSPPLARAAAPESHVHVTFDDKTIAVRQPDGREHTIAWNDLGAVSVLTKVGLTDEPDLFWLLTDREGHRSAVLPMGASGEHDLLKAMQSRLHGFDNMAVVEAMSNVADASFLVWEHGRREAGNPA